MIRNMRLHILMYGVAMVSACVFVPVIRCAAQGLSITKTSIEKTITECSGSNKTLSPACSVGSKIAITSYADGFKTISSYCPVDGTASGNCCTYNATVDCLQDAHKEPRYVDALSGRDSGIITTSSVAPSSDGCNASSYTATSVFSVLGYSCIPGSSVESMCTSTSKNGTSEQPLYIQNKNYPKSGILSNESYCNCSVEVSKFTTIQLYILHLDLYNTPGNCLQNLTVYDGKGRVLRTFMCEDHPYNTIVEETLNTTYVRLEMNNQYSVTNEGKFWLGFMSNGSLSLNCPAKEQMKFAGCVNLTNPQHGTVNVTGLSYLDVAMYTCNSGFTVGNASDPYNLTRYCQEDGTWSGQEPACEPVECPTLQNPPNGLIQSQNTAVGGQATYTCNDGFETSTETLVRTCLITGEWDGEELQCSPKECPTLQNPPNGLIQSQNTSVGGLAAYICYEGYEAPPETLIRTCLIKGEWDGEEPQCSKECPKLQNPTNGLIQSQNTSVGGLATYICVEGYDAPPETLIRTCLITGEWEGEEPQCSTKEKDEGSPIIAIVLGITIPLLLIAAGVILYFIYFRKRKMGFYSLLKSVCCPCNEVKDNDGATASTRKNIELSKIKDRDSNIVYQNTNDKGTMNPTNHNTNDTSDQSYQKTNGNVTLNPTYQNTNVTTDQSDQNTKGNGTMNPTYQNTNSLENSDHSDQNTNGNGTMNPTYQNTNSLDTSD